MGGPRSARTLPVEMTARAGSKTEGSRAIAHLGPTIDSAVCAKGEATYQSIHHRQHSLRKQTNLIQLGGHIQIEDLSLSLSILHSDQRVDFQIRKVQLDINRVQPRQEIHEGFLPLFSYDILQQTRFDGFSRGKFASDGYEESEGFRINISYFYSSFMGEENKVSFSD